MRFAVHGMLATTLLVLSGPAAFGESPRREAGQRVVLAELFTSQGCDMCPQAERVLGSLAERHDRVVPIAFHVDYFNDPWKDVFSDELYSQRQMAYNEI
ncbi:DUF1223 domain-containing protein [Singulisphaera sp. PoT]|uniref:DUF1223 domain-containing protein n=1 Tax=Singulisphaera sp. PoT TaxID=3411797 RepID=UPI003BF47D09